MSVGGLTGSGGDSIAGSTPAPTQKQPDSSGLISYARSGPSRSDGPKSGGSDKSGTATTAANDAGVDVPTDEQSQKMQDFDAVRGRPSGYDGGRGDVRLAQASIGTMTDAMPEMIGGGSGSDSSSIRLERNGQTDGGMLGTIGNVAKKGAAKAGGVVTGILVPTNSSHDETLTIPGHPQYRITGKESEVNRTLEVQNADGSWEPIGDVAVTRGGVDQAEINKILKDRGFQPIDPLPTTLPGTPIDGPKGPGVLSTPDQGARGADIVSTPNDGSRGAGVLSTPIPDKQAPQILDMEIYEKNAKHIFRDVDGHVKDTPENRKAFDELTENPDNFKGTDKRGNDWYVQNLPDGKQMWASVRDGQIRNAGINDQPRTFDPDTGLSQNIEGKN